MIDRTRTWKLRGGVGGALAGALVVLTLAAAGGSAPAQSSTNDTARTAFLQPDGRVVALGGSEGRFALARYTTSGSPDRSFGDHGTVTTDIDPNAVDEILAAALQDDGKIVAAGRSGERVAIVRYLADGSLDRGFGKDGIDIAGSGRASTLAVQADGSITVGIQTRAGSRLLALDPDGVKGADPAGVATLPDDLRAIAAGADGTITFAGLHEADGQSSLVVTRFHRDGSPDAAFGTEGTVTAVLPPDAPVDALAVDAEGSALAAGPRAFIDEGSESAAVDTAGPRLFLARLGPTGSLDAPFGGGIALSGGLESATSALDTSGGGLMVAGTAGTGRSADFAVSVYNADGSLDTSFGEGGTVVTNFGVAAPTARDRGRLHSVRVQPHEPPPAAGGHRKPHRRGPPHPVPAWYINADNFKELKRFAAADTCSFARSQPRSANRLLILDFGGARAYLNGDFGASVNNAAFTANNKQIKAALKVASDAYASCHRRGKIRIAYGVTNHFKSRYAASRGHAIGVHQARTVRGVWHYQRRHGYYPAERAGVAGDVETGYWGPKYSKKLANGAKSEWPRGYYMFGTAGGCPPHPGLDYLGRDCFNGWSKDDVAHVANAGGGDPLPEVYYRGGPNHFDQAAQWVHVARAWNRKHATPFTFAGTTGSTQFSGMSPGESWVRMKRKAGGRVARELLNFKEDHWLAKRADDG